MQNIPEFDRHYKRSDQDGQFDLLIVGSGPSGAQAAAEALPSGLKIGLVDIGFTDDKYQALIPERAFSEIRRTDSRQADYFLGDNPEEAFQSQARAGAHLTPPRQHMIREMDRLFPLESESFLPLQSTALGGLGVSWGSNAFTFEDFELKRIGLPVSEMQEFYDRIASEVGVSGPTEGDDLAPLITQLKPVQPPLMLDSNAQKILSTYRHKRDSFLRDQFFLGQSLLAVLSQPIGGRQANPYWDMDFWSDHRRSVYRPRFTIEHLKSFSNFTYIPGKLALRFEEVSEHGVRLYCRDVRTHAGEVIVTKRLLLAAGAINSGKLALSSFHDTTTKIPILTNPNHWVAAIHAPMLGRGARDERYSLAQLTALLRVSEDPQDYVLGQFYSYRSLLLSRLISNLPLPPRLGVKFLRFFMTSFTCINLHFSDSPTTNKWLQLRRRGSEEVLAAEYGRTVEEEKRLRAQEWQFVRQLLRLHLIPLGINRPAHGASIHYAGSLPFSEEDRPLTCDAQARLRGTRHVYVADGSTWKFLPAKGLTLTLMAHARRVAKVAVKSI